MFVHFWSDCPAAGSLTRLDVYHHEALADTVRVKVVEKQ